MADSTQQKLEPGEHVWYTDEQGTRRAAVVFAPAEDDLIVTGIGLDGRGRSWRVPAAEIVSKIQLRDEHEPYL